MSTVTIRRARDADRPLISEIAVAAYEIYLDRMGGQRPAPMDVDYADAIARKLVWVAEVDGRTAGFLVLVGQPTYVLVDNIAVCPEHQGVGIGRAFMGLAEDYARSSGVNALRLYTNVAMVENQRLYLRLGYVEVGRLTENGYSRVLYEKLLDA